MASDLLFELRCEELPPTALPAAAGSLADALRDAFAGAGLAPASVTAAWTPRRIAVWAHGLPERTADREDRVNGPKLKAAYGPDGSPTRAAEGFARKVGLPVGGLRRDEECVYAVVRTPGRGAAEIAAELLPALPQRVRWRKSMRWGAPAEFARPIRGVVALLGADVVACRVAGIEAGRVTRGHPFLDPRDVRLDSASRDDYVSALRGAHVLADPAERRDAVLAAARRAVPGIEPRDGLLDEVTNLVEWPSALLGRFDARFLELPPRFLVTVMEHHQRFFPVRAAAGDEALEPRFVAILDRDEASVEVSRRGFERVLVPRLHDAMFFLEHDRRTPLEARLPRLADVLYHRKLGTVRDKAARLEALAAAVADALRLPDEERARAARAGLLAKCDLVTLLVAEFPELQGKVGAFLAAREGEHPDVCAAVGAQYEREFPAGASLPGAAVALLLAENLDVLCRFGTEVGLPSGSADPFGVRRAAITLLEVCERFAPGLGLVAAVRAAGGDDPVVAFLDTRLRQRLRDEGFRHDHLDAVRAWRSVGEFRGRLADLRALTDHPEFARLLEVAERCRNILKGAEAPSMPPRPEALREPAEVALHGVWSELRSTFPPPPEPLSRDDVARAAAALAAPLHRFFAEVYVNVDDAAVRANRLALLGEIDRTLLRFADLCRVVRPA